jgi:DNA-binding response OmpR family regulator
MDMTAKILRPVLNKKNAGERKLRTETEQILRKFQTERSELPKPVVDQLERTILVADDAADTRLIVSRSLEFDGFNCVQASDGKQVLELARIYKPSLIVLDLMLPHLNGFQVLLKLQNSQPNTKICIISALDKPEFVRRAFEFGADDYLVKPILPDVLSYKVRTILKDEKREGFFAANSDLQAKIVVGEKKFDCKISKISEVGVSVVAKELPTPACGIMSLQCKELERIFGDQNKIFVKSSGVTASARPSTQLDFVAMPESRVEKLRALVIKGKFLSEASFNN